MRERDEVEPPQADVEPEGEGSTVTGGGQEQVIASEASLAACAEAGVEATSYLYRHACGDWGDVDEQDKRANDQAARHGGQLFSSYTLPTGVRLWIVTAADRSVTRLLLPEEY